jgi:RNA polymerase sigma-70 factor (ECF subfamily)
MGKQKIEKDDILLVDEFKNGNSEAFGEIYNRYFKKVVRQLKVLLKGDVEKAEDLASDVFLKVMKNIDKYKHEKLSSWIHTMARNVFLDSLRLVKEKENKKTISIDVQLEFYNGSKSLFQLSDSNLEIEENEKERNSKLLKALKSLKESDLKLIDLRFYQGLNYKEIAIEVGKTENYCRVAIDRIKSKLKKII